MPIAGRMLQPCFALTPSTGRCSAASPPSPVHTFSPLSGFPGLTSFPARQTPPHPLGLRSSEGVSLTSHHHPDPLCLNTHRASLPRAGLRLPSRHAHSLLSSAFTALSATVAHPLSGNMYLMPLSLDQTFLILCRISTTFYDAWLVLS